LNYSPANTNNLTENKREGKSAWL